MLAQEKGIDLYNKVPDIKCIAAQNWWKENNAVWKNVRDKWQTLFDRHKDLNLEPTVDKKPLFMFLFDLKPDVAKAETDAIIDKFVK